MNALEVFLQNDGETTKCYYAELEALGPRGHIAVCLFRAQKRSTAAKSYRRGKWRRAAYDVKSWSMQELCKALEVHAAEFGIAWGWKSDPAVVFGEEESWVLYVDLPTGQASFHSPQRFSGPDYGGVWDGQCSAAHIIQFCDSVAKGQRV